MLTKRLNNVLLLHCAKQVNDRMNNKDILFDIDPGPNQHIKLTFVWFRVGKVEGGLNAERLARDYNMGVIHGTRSQFVFRCSDIFQDGKFKNDRFIRLRHFFQLYTLWVIHQHSVFAFWHILHQYLHTKFYEIQKPSFTVFSLNFFHVHSRLSFFFLLFHKQILKKKNHIFLQVSLEPALEGGGRQDVRLWASRRQILNDNSCSGCCILLCLIFQPCRGLIFIADLLVSILIF